MANNVDLPGGFVIGAGAGSSKFVGVNCEVNRYLSAVLVHSIVRDPVCLVCHGRMF